jgi:hypothetical protein
MSKEAPVTSPLEPWTIPTLLGRLRTDPRDQAPWTELGWRQSVRSRSMVWAVSPVTSLVSREFRFESLARARSDCPRAGQSNTPVALFLPGPVAAHSPAAGRW